MKTNNTWGLITFLTASICIGTTTFASEAEPDSKTFLSKAIQLLPVEKRYDYHKKLSKGPIHRLRRDPKAQPTSKEMSIPDTGWKVLVHAKSGPVVQYASNDLRDYLKISMKVSVELESKLSLKNWAEQKNVIIAGTPDQLPGMGQTLKGPKDYEIRVTPNRIIVCGFDERGVMYGLFNLEARFSLREGPYLPHNLKTVRHSLYQTRMVLSWLGWMEWPDSYLSHMAHDGYDAIFASVYANPTDSRIDSTELYSLLLQRIKRQNPARVKDLIKRAAKFGIKVYTPILYRITDEPDSEEILRKIVRDIVTKFPEIHGHILLTEGFYYDNWASHGGKDKKKWAREWAKGVAIVVEECHKVNPDIEVLPWEYNIDFRPQNADIKRYFITQLPKDTIPLVTWENGKSFKIDGFQGFLRDYSINQVGPAEVTVAQIDETKKRGMKVYSKVDTFASWQFGTTPYIPAPYQWGRRYEKLKEFGVNGTLETWSNGYKPNFIAEMRAWSCWTDSFDQQTLLKLIARREFGKGSEDIVLKAWKHFSKAIQLVPDTGPSMGTNFAIANPLFFKEAQPRAMMLKHSWRDPVRWQGYLGATINPYWPYTHSRMVFYPNFANHSSSKAEWYARSVSGITPPKSSNQSEKNIVLPVFNKYLLLAADEFETGLLSYRQAALKAPKSKKIAAFKEVLIVEQMQRMLRSLHAILEFEDIRFRLMKTKDPNKAKPMVDRLSQILTAEIARTELSLLTAQRDSRLGYEFEQDYVYTPYVLTEKIALLRKTRDQYLPEYRKAQGIAE